MFIRKKLVFEDLDRIHSFWATHRYDYEGADPEPRPGVTERAKHRMEAIEEAAYHILGKEAERKLRMKYHGYFQS